MQQFAGHLSTREMPLLHAGTRALSRHLSSAGHKQHSPIPGKNYFSLIFSGGVFITGRRDKTVLIPDTIYNSGKKISDKDGTRSVKQNRRVVCLMLVYVSIHSSVHVVCKSVRGSLLLHSCKKSIHFNQHVALEFVLLLCVLCCWF